MIECHYATCPNHICNFHKDEGPFCNGDQCIMGQDALDLFETLRQKKEMNHRFLKQPCVSCGSTEHTFIVSGHDSSRDGYYCHKCNPYEIDREHDGESISLHRRTEDEKDYYYAKKIITLEEEYEYAKRMWVLRSESLHETIRKLEEELEEVLEESKKELRLKKLLIRKKICPDCALDLEPFYSRDADHMMYKCPRCNTLY